MQDGSIGNVPKESSGEKIKPVSSCVKLMLTAIEEAVVWREQNKAEGLPYGKA